MFFAWLDCLDDNERMATKICSLESLSMVDIHTCTEEHRKTDERNLVRFALSKQTR